MFDLYTNFFLSVLRLSFSNISVLIPTGIIFLIGTISLFRRLS